MHLALLDNHFYLLQLLHLRLGYYYLMLKYRKAAGYSTGSDEIYIPSFINFCGEKYPDAELITKEMVDAWLAFYSFRKAGTQMNVIGIIRHFTNFLNSIGKDDYVPD